MAPNVPYERTVELRPSNRQGIDVQATPDMFGAAQARGMGQIARGLDSVQSAANAVRDLDAMNEAKSGLTAYQRAAQEKNYGPNGYFTLDGKSAVDGYKPWQDENEKLRMQFRPKDPVAAQKYDEASQGWQTNQFQQGIVHQAQARKTWTTQESDSRLALLGDQAAGAYKDPKQLKLLTDAALAEVDENARLNGFSPEKVKLNKLNVTSGINKNVILRYLQNEDTKGATDFLAANRDKMSANDIYEIEGQLKPAQQLAEAQQNAGNILSGGNRTAAPQQPPNLRGDGMPPPQTISRQWVPRQDSGPFAFMVRRVENQSGDTGAVSSAGALGLAQVLPGTAREQAKKLGMTDVAGMSDGQMRKHFAAHPEDNLRIGEAYYMEMRQRYGGDDKAAVIAYNAGPARADEWIAGGRKDGTLPKETQNYVQKVFGEVNPARRRGRGGQANDKMPDMSTSGGFQGDQFEFLKGRSSHGVSVYGLKPDFAANLAAMIQDAPPEIRDNLTLASDYRDSDVQAANYAKSDGSGKMVARPGGSSHEYGLAADLGWKGGGIRSLPPEAKRWLHANAGRYNLNFRMSWEDWHIEPADARQRIASGQAGAPSAAGPRGNLTADSVDWSSPPMNGTVTQGRTGLSYRSRMPGYDQIMSQVNAIQDPTVRAKTLQLVQSQLAMASAADEADHKAAKQQLWNWVDQGNPVSSVPADLRSRVSMEDMSAAFNYEEARAKGPAIQTDQDLLYKMSRFAAANPEGFANIDLLQYKSRLNSADFKALTEKQTAFIADPDKVTRDNEVIKGAMSQGDTYIKAMGFTTDKKSQQDIGFAEGQMRMAIIQQIEAFKAANNGKNPGYADIENMWQTLSRPVVFRGQGSTWLGLGGAPETAGFVFQGRTRPDGTLMVGTSTYDQIPTDLRQHITNQLAGRLGRQPSQVEVAAAYNDFTSKYNPAANPADYPQQGPAMPTALQQQTPAPAAAPPGVVPPPQATGAQQQAPAVYDQQQPATPPTAAPAPAAPPPEPFIMSTTIGQDTGPKDQSRVPEGGPNIQPGSQQELDALQGMVDANSAEMAKTNKQEEQPEFSKKELNQVREYLQSQNPNAFISDEEVLKTARRQRKQGLL